MSNDIWIADDDRGVRFVLAAALRDAGLAVREFDAADAVRAALRKARPALLLTDVRMPGENGLALLEELQARGIGPVIVMSAFTDVATTAAAYRAGAADYLAKPFDLDHAVATVRRVLADGAEAAAPAATAPAPTHALLGESAAMREVFRLIGRVAASDLNVLVTGETGTGKELVARALHEESARRAQPFVALNTAAIPSELLESELFGHEAGAFTGATRRVAGRFEQAEGGTLFLDEIGDMPMEAQTRLLRVLQQGEYTTVGGRTPIKSDVRIIAATNKDLRQLIQQGLFREDLFFRLNVVPLRLPPLRERVEDIPDLIRHFFAQAQREGLPAKQIDSAALDRLKRHRWPGNVRELENLARRLAALYPQETITAAVIESELAQPAIPVGGEETHAEESLSAAVERHLSAYFAGFENGLPPAGLYHRILREVEYPLLTAALAATRGNQIRAADLLGVNRNTLRKKIKDLEIQV
ncbi:MAG: nitrogen regulation protein NR(I), partial [Xanthomonadaceae bacterium]|nr:nitrogen regulation protein NR(I) [Xanthomonadaceae bacterium]